MTAATIHHHKLNMAHVYQRRSDLAPEAVQPTQSYLGGLALLNSLRRSSFATFAFAITSLNYTTSTFQASLD
jgi:hypothetical protein